MAGRVRTTAVAAVRAGPSLGTGSATGIALARAPPVGAPQASSTVEPGPVVPTRATPAFDPASPLLDADKAALQVTPMLARLSEAERELLYSHLELHVNPAGAALLEPGKPIGALEILVDGTAQIERDHTVWRRLKPGDFYGIPLPGHVALNTIEALSEVRVARLTWDEYASLRESHPGLLLLLIEGAVEGLFAELMASVDSGQRDVPRRQQIDLHYGQNTTRVDAGVRPRSVLPPEIEGAKVVAALVNRRPESLDTRIFWDALLEPVTLASYEGRQVFRRSAGLALLEAASRIDPRLELRLGTHWGWAQIATVEQDVDVREFSHRIADELALLSTTAPLPFREENWHVDEARAMFEGRGWNSAAQMLATWREPTVTLASFGAIRAVYSGPMLGTSRELAGLRVFPHSDGLLLDFGDDIMKQLIPESVDRRDEYIRDVVSPSFRDGPETTRQEHLWLTNLGIRSVGDLNERCISGAVDQVIRTSEGMHEKRIGQLADEILARRGRTQMVCIAGPTSSGKTTLTKRLSVQLEINGIRPVLVSLDNYFKDRDKTPLGPSGEQDLESAAAIDAGLLREQLDLLRAGHSVNAARYDFVNGKSLRDGGPEMRLGPSDLLVLEGTHAASRGILGERRSRSEVFTIFVHPVQMLPLDRLTAILPEEVRLIRRIVRDRQHRGRSAAETIARWPAVSRSELMYVFPSLSWVDVTFDSSLPYELSVLKIYADRYLLEVPTDHPSYPVAYRLRRLVDRFVTIYADQVPPTSILREFFGGSGFQY